MPSASVTVQPGTNKVDVEITTREIALPPIVLSASSILIDESGSYRVNGQALVDARLRTLQAAIYKISAGDTTLPMIITADAQAAHESVVRAMDAAGQMGFVHLSITTRQPDEGTGRG